ncbi:type 1 fimbrial protein [Photorhabdus noenieputensis]|nr:type 1 fimbrial protein [Photorhabdus noenieputensis]
MLRMVMLRLCWGMLVLLFLAGGVMAESEDPKAPPATRSSGIDVDLFITVVPEPCDVGISGSDINGSELNFGSLPAAEFSQAGHISNPRRFNLELTNCGDPDVSPNGPVITVSGNTIDAEQGLVFRDPVSGSDDNASEGLGFIVHLGDEGKIGWDDLVINNHENRLDSLFFDDGRAQLPVTVAVARGKDSKVIRPGSLIARVAFTYSYP